MAARWAARFSTGCWSKPGLPKGPTAAGITASNLLIFVAVLALPVLVLPALLGGAVNRDLITATIIGAIAFAVLAALGVLLLAYDRPLAFLGRLLQGARNRLRRKSEPLRSLPRRLVRERDRLLATLGPSWRIAVVATVGRWAFDYATLLAALAAVGSTPRPALVLLAFCAAQVLAQVPVTPGGLGFVEAGLTAMLALAGVSAGSAVLATFAYRLFNYWLQLPAGLVGYALHRRRFSSRACRPGLGIHRTTIVAIRRPSAPSVGITSTGYLPVSKSSRSKRAANSGSVSSSSSSAGIATWAGRPDVTTSSSWSPAEARIGAGLSTAVSTLRETKPPVGSS